MGLETGTYIDDLVITNPPGGDDKRQGDDHLRLIKTVLKNTFPRASKAFYFPDFLTKSANYTVVSTDNGYTVAVDTSAGSVTLTLPALSASDDGWSFNVIKTNSGTNPVFLLPASGTINGFTKIRRTSPLLVTNVIWTGSLWVATRPTGNPIGSIVDYFGSTLPNGFLWADGSAFSSTDFVELNAVLGAAVAPDMRGRVTAGRDDMGGSAAGRLTNAISGITGTTLGAAGGSQSGVAAHTHGFTTGTQSVDHTHAVPSLNTTTVQSGVGAVVVTGYGGVGAAQTGNVSANHTHGGTTDSNSITGANVQPTIVCNKLVVAE